MRLLPEYGGSKPAWIEDALTRQLPARYRKVRAIVWFNKNADDMDWIIESSPIRPPASRRRPRGSASGL